MGELDDEQVFERLMLTLVKQHCGEAAVAAWLPLNGDVVSSLFVQLQVIDAVLQV